VQGSLRPAVITPYLHGNSNFIEIIWETLRKSLCHSTGQHLFARVLRYLKIVRVTTVILQTFIFNAFTLKFLLMSIGQAPNHVIFYKFLSSSVFLLNSRPHYFPAATRSYFNILFKKQKRHLLSPRVTRLNCRVPYILLLQVLVFSTSLPESV